MSIPWLIVGIVSVLILVVPVVVVAVRHWDWASVWEFIWRIIIPTLVISGLIVSACLGFIYGLGLEVD